MLENNSFDLAIIFLLFFREKSDLNSDLKDTNSRMIHRTINLPKTVSSPLSLRNLIAVVGLGHPVYTWRGSRETLPVISGWIARMRGKNGSRRDRGEKYRTILGQSYSRLEAFSRFAGQRLDLLVRGNSDSPALYIHVHVHVGEKVYPVYRSMYNRAIILAGTSPGYAWSS